MIWCGELKEWKTENFKHILWKTMTLSFLFSTVRRQSKGKQTCDSPAFINFSGPVTWACPWHCSCSVPHLAGAPWRSSLYCALPTNPALATFCRILICRSMCFRLYMWQGMLWSHAVCGLAGYLLALVPWPTSGSHARAVHWTMARDPRFAFQLGEYGIS